jgi:hypothetical protein
MRIGRSHRYCVVRWDRLFSTSNYDRSHNRDAIQVSCFVEVVRFSRGSTRSEADIPHGSYASSGSAHTIGSGMLTLRPD